MMQARLWSLVLALVLLPALVMAAFDDCECNESWTSFACTRCFGPCPRTLEPVKRFEELTTKPGPAKKLMGQERAAVLIADALRAASGKKPLTFHFCGENGVGKSHTALLLAEAYFAYKDKKTDMYKGLLWISGKQYQMAKSEEEIKAAREYIHEQIIDHLATCPQAIIVIDEAEMMRADILRVVGAFMDDSQTTVSSLKDPSKRVNTKEAIIILISDFGRDEIRTGDSWDEIAERVHRETKAILQEDLMVQRIQYHIPFSPVPDLNCTARVGKVSAPVEELVSLLVRQLKEHPAAKRDNIVIKKVGADIHAIAEKLIHFMVAHEHYCERNYRGIEGLFATKVVGPILKQMPEPRPSTQEVTVLVKVPFDQSVVQPARAPGGGREDL